jgi:hypothetical protein
MKDARTRFLAWIEILEKVFPYSDAIAKNDLQFSVEADDLILRIRGKPFVVKYLKPIRDADSVPLEFGPHPVLYLADRLSTEKAEEMRAANRLFVDLRGNAFVSIPGVYLFVAGRNAKAAVSAGLVPGPTGKLFKKSGIQLIALLLTDPNLDADPDHAWINRSVRDLADKAKLSTGSVSDLLAALKARDFLVTDGNAKRLINRKKLLDAWAHGYAEFRLRRKRQCFTVDTIAWWEKRRPSQEGFRWGGEPAAAILTSRFLRPGKLTIYARQPLYDLVVEANLHMSAGDWAVEILEPLPGIADGPDSNCVHPLLVYADLIATGDNRNDEAARRIYADHLRSTIESA